MRQKIWHELEGQLTNHYQYIYTNGGNKSAHLNSDNGKTQRYFLLLKGTYFKYKPTTDQVVLLLALC